MIDVKTAEKLAEENQTCRAIAQEVSVFGITDRQRKFLIYLLALELEDVVTLQALADVLRDDITNESFIGHVEPEVDR